MSLLPILSTTRHQSTAERLKHSRQDSVRSVPCFDLITVTLQFLDFLFEIRFVLFFLIYVLSVIDLCHTLSSSMSQHPVLCKK